ncbi:MAG: hypothetical protein H7Z40_09460 [Phycisphaerae bacterium]|nr:hypothetical protein [Gemmatimonadaceae bacterium]
MVEESVSNSTKTKALTAFAAAVVITIGAWFFIDRATTRGLARLDHIERVYAACQADYANARNVADTSRVDAQPLSALIDSGKTGAPLRCGELRRPESLAAQDSARRVQNNRGSMPARDGR